MAEAVREQRPEGRGGVEEEAEGPVSGHSENPFGSHDEDLLLTQF